MLPETLDRIPPDQRIASVTAIGAFDTRTRHDVIAARGAAALIPPRKNAKPWKRRAKVPATKPCASHVAQAGRSGADGAAITAEAALKPGCTV